MNEWETEPDQEEFVHAELPCLILRTPLRHLCGYVGVPPSHPMYQRKYDDINVAVHGGLTFSHLGGFREIYREPAYKPSIDPPDAPIGSPEMLLWMEEAGNYLRESTVIERLEPDPDDKWPEGFWWVGFDCAHSGDYIPLGIPSIPGTYRNWAWVKAKTQWLAEQLAAMMPMPDYNEWIESVKKGGDTIAG